jgi:hypothetical protein
MPHLFWLSTFIPGLAVLLAISPRDTRHRIWAVLASSFVLTVALFTPVVATAFVFHLRFRTIAIVYATVVVAGVLVILRFATRARLRRLAASADGWEIAGIVCALGVAWYLKGAATDDTLVHVAKIRYLLDFGFSLQDPYSPLPIIETRHHISTHQVLFGLAAWFSGEDPLKVWFQAGWFFTLVCACGVRFLAASVFRPRWIGSLVMLAFLVDFLSERVIVYPYIVTPYAVLAVLLAQIIEAVERPSRSAFLKVLAGSLTLAVFHVGFWVIVAMCVVPVATVWIVWRAQRPWRQLALAAATLLPGLPFLLITASQSNHVDAQQGARFQWMLRDIGQWIIVDPLRLAWMFPAAAMAVLLCVIRPTARARHLVLAGITMMAIIYMFTPGLFGLLTTVMPYWLVRRCEYVAGVVAVVTVIGGLSWMVRQNVRTRLGRSVFVLTVLLTVLVVDLEKMKQRWRYRTQSVPALQDALNLQEAVRTELPGRPLVATTPELSLMLPAVHPASVMAPELGHANPADGELLRRHGEARELLDTRTSTDRRRQIIAANAIAYILVRHDPDARLQEDFSDVGDLVASRDGFMLFRVGEGRAR